MVKITVIVPTARDDYALLGLPKTHIFEPTINSLKTQTLKDFELIIADSLFEDRSNLFKDNKFQDEKLPFQVNHIPPKPSPYREKGMWHACDNVNTAFIHADGELLIIFGDCGELLDKNALQKFWDWYEKSYFTSALVTYFHKDEPLYYNKAYRKLFANYKKQEGLDWSYNQIVAYLGKIYKEKDVIRDSRWRYVEKAPNGVFMNAPIDQWWYGYTSISMDAILEVNGCNELFDGSKGLEDCDLGSRLKILGYDNFVLDSKLAVIEHWHGPVSEKAVWYKGRNWKSNYTIMQLSQQRRRYRANSERLSDGDIEFIRHNSIGWDGVTEQDVKNPLFDWWIENQPIFSLRELRLET